MSDYPQAWEFDLVLKDGGVMRVRPVRPDDGEELRALLKRSGPRSIYQRFMRDKDDLSPEEVEYFTVLDYDKRMAFAAIVDGTIIGIGRYDVLEDEPAAAEVAFLVEDAHQGRGVGSLLLDRLADYARQRNIVAFKAYVLADNHAMLRVFRNSGFGVTRDEASAGVYTVELPTAESGEHVAAEWEREKRAVAASIMPIFYPHSVAVVGASRNETSIGGRLFRNLLGGEFTGPIYPVNPSAEVVASVKAYPSIGDVPGSVDLAFIVVPAAVATEAVRQCAAAGVKGIVMITAGFSETGDEGEVLEDELLEVVRSAGMRMVGPNCMGVLNTDPAISLDGQFGPRYPPPGNVAMSSQSGALGIAILDYARQLNIGISTFISMGNKADISGNDVLLYWEDDPRTDVILLYLESFGNPRRFARIARRIGRTKPIVAVKSGRTASGARAASSHTGSLASLDVAVDALFHQAGVIRTTTLEELFDVTSLLANQPVPEGRRVAILSNAGGPGILAADALESQGLEVVEFSSELQARLRGHLSAEASTRNPVDMIASAGASQYAACLNELVASEELDAVIAIHIPAAPTGSDEIAAAIRAAAEHSSKTMLAVFMDASGAPAELVGGGVQVPTYLFPEPAAQALARAAAYGEWRRRPEGTIAHFEDVSRKQAQKVVEEALARMGDGGGWLEPAEVEAVLGAYGLGLAKSGVAATAAEAVAIASDIDGPVVLKVISDKALHKSDIGGVELDIVGADEIAAAFERVTAVVEDASSALVQEFVVGGHEVILGMTEDPSFGPLLAFGLGGIFVELIGDVAFRIHPVTDSDIEEMIAGVKSARLLEGYRGNPAGDIAELKVAMQRLSQLVDEIPEISEMDLNPVKVLEPGQGIRVVDARVRVRTFEGPWVPSRKDVPASASRG
ncbi:MAG: GNAT family N-acetyltransferase [Acidimicrobiia bacterium]